MSLPIFTNTSGVYSFLWEEEQINITLNRIHEHKDGRTTAEIKIATTREDIPPHLHQSQFNLSAQRSRAELAKKMTERYPMADWEEVLEQVCVLSLEHLRQGEPVQELWTSEDVPAPQFLLEPILYKGLPTIIFGEKAVCKSTIAIIAYTCLILPWHDNPLGWVAPDRPIKALLADYEVDYEITQYNAKRLQEGMGLPAFPVFYRRCSLPLADDIEQIRERMAEIKAEAIIIDSLGPAVGGDLKLPGEALRFTSALRQLRCAALIIGQTSKEKEKKQASVFGSTFFEYYSRNILELRKVQEEGEDTLDIALYHRYCNLGRRQPAMGFKMHFTDQSIDIQRKEITAPELVERMSTQYRIMNLLKSGAMSTKEIMEGLDIPRGNAGMCIKRLKDKGKILKVEDKWGLPFL